MVKKTKWGYQVQTEQGKPMSTPTLSQERAEALDKKINRLRQLKNESSFNDIKEELEIDIEGKEETD